MKHRVSGRKLGRTSAHRVAVLRNLSTELFERERIRTTLMKAKELRPFAERLITLSKSGTLHARRRAARHVMRADVLQKLFDTISARFAERPGGYTRILKLGPRRGDGAEMALIELIGSEPKAEAPSEEKKEKKTLGRIRERLTRRKKAPAASAGTGGEAQEAGSKKAAPRKKAASRKSSPRKASGAKTASKAGGGTGGSKKKSASKKGSGKSSSK